MSTGDRLARELSLTTVRFARLLRVNTARSAVTLSQLSVMQTLANAGPLTPGQLAESERVQPPSMTRLIASLVDLGMVHRTPHPTDQRQVIIGLSAQGEDMIGGESAGREKWLRERLAQLGAQDRDILTRSIAIVNELLAEERTRTTAYAR